jgi:hypothetical protein
MADDVLVFGGGGQQPDKPADDVLMFGSSVASDPTRGIGPSSMPQNAPTWGDVGHGVMQGVHGVEKDFSGLNLAIHPEDPYWAGKVHEAATAEATDTQAMTPGGQKAQEEPWYRHPVLSAAEQAPGLVAMGAPMVAAGPLAPVVGAGVFAGQGVGSLEARGREQGFEPTLWQKGEAAGIGAATGVALEAAGPMAGKIATNKLIQSALGLTGETVTFGTSGAAAETLGQTAEQGAGVREGYDTGQIAGAGVSGAESGALFGVRHLFRGREAPPPGGGQDQAGTQTGGAATIGRKKPVVGDETKPRAGVAMRPDEATERPPPQGPAADPDLAAAAKGEPIAKLEPVPEPPNIVNRPRAPEPAPPESVTEQTPQVQAPPQVEAPAPEPPAPQFAPEPVTPGVTEAPAPEGQADLQAQHEQLLDKSNPREAMIFPAGVEPFALPDKGYGQIGLKDGRIVQFDRNGPNTLNVSKVRQMANADRLNELLQLGPVNKQEVAADSVAGARPVAVATERSPEGAEVKAALGTTATLPDQVQHLEATKTPDSTVQVEPVQQVLAAREQAQAPPVAPPQVTPGVSGRVLPAEIPPAERAALEEQSKAQAAQVRQNIRQMERTPGEKLAGHRTKAEVSTLAEQNRIADDIVGKHPIGASDGLAMDPTQAGGKGARLKLEARLRNMVDAATKAGVKIPREISETVDPAHMHSAGKVILREAQQYLKGAATRTSADIQKFLMREHELRTGGPEGLRRVLQERAAEGRERAAEHGAAKEVATAEPEAPHEAPGEAEDRELERIDRERAEQHEAEAARHLEERRAESEAMRKEQAKAAAETKAPATVGFKVETVKRRTLRKQEMQPDEGAKPETIKTQSMDGEDIEVTPKRSTTASEAIKEHFNPLRYSSEMRPMMNRLSEAVNRLAGDTPVHYVSDADMTKLLGERAHGVYDADTHAIFLNSEHPRHDTALHEAFHAATARALLDSKPLHNLMTALHKELNSLVPKMQLTDAERHEITYALSDPEELLTGLMTERTVQDVFKRAKISPELAHRLEIPKWRKATMWEGALSLIRRVLGLGPRDTSAVEAAMALTEHTMWKKSPGMAMEAAGRLDRNDGMGRRLRQITEPEESEKAERAMPERMRDLGENVGKAAIDAKDNLTAAAQRNLPRVMNGVQMSRSYGKLFTDKAGNAIDDLFGIGRRKGAALAKRFQDDAPLIADAHVLSDKFAGHQDTMSKLEMDATKFNVRPEQDFKPPKDPVKAAMENWQHNAHAAHVAEAFKSLPKELQDNHIARRDAYAAKSIAIADQHIDSVLDNFPLPDGATRASTLKRIRENDLSEADKAHYEDLGMLDSLQRDIAARKGDKVYFHGLRDGDHVVVGYHPMPEGGHSVDYSGSKLPENVREFDDRAEAQKFTAGTELYATPKIRYYLEDPNRPGHFAPSVTDPVTGKEVRAGPHEYDAKRYQVALQHEHTEVHDSHAKAKRAGDAMREAGLQNVSGVLDKRQEGNWSRINTDAGAAMERRIKDRNDLTAAQKDAAIEAARSYSLVSRGGFQSHLVTRRNISGARYASAEALRSYMHSANTHMVNKQFAGETADVMQRLEAMDDKNRDTKNSYTSSAVMNELRDRVYRSPESMASKNAPWVNRLLMLGYMRWLVGPRHLMMMQSHPYAYSAPQMAGRHGVGVYKAIHTAAKDLGGDFMGARVGVKSAFDSARSMFVKDPARSSALSTSPHVTADMIARLTDEGERKAMTKLVESGELHSGFDDDFYGATGMKKVDAMMRQLTVALTAYRAELSKTGSEAKALDYARKTVQDTVGVHSSMDVSSMMKNPMAKIFFQFKHFPMRQIELMARNVYNGFKGESPEVRKEAWRSFAYQTTSAFSMAGVHGLPIGILKPLGLLGMALGVTPTPSQIDDRMRRGIGEMIGATGANAVMDGVLAAIPHTPNVSNMFSYEMEMMYGEPRAADWKSYLFDQATGATGGVVVDTGKGLGALAQGDIPGAIQNMPLPRVLPDLVKAYGLATQGTVTKNGDELLPASYEDAAWRMLGFGTKQQQRLYAGKEAAQEDIKEEAKAQAEEKKAARGEQLKQRKETIMGLPVTKGSRSLLKERQEAYQ